MQFSEVFDLFAFSQIPAQKFENPKFTASLLVCLLFFLSRWIGEFFYFFTKLLNDTSNSDKSIIGGDFFVSLFVRIQLNLAQANK
jgi:hypothetical protein